MIQVYKEAFKARAMSLRARRVAVYVKRWLCKLKATTATNALCVQRVEASRVLFVLSRVTTDLLCE
jgi:hypothetical protein